MAPKQVLPCKPAQGDFHPQLIAAWLLCAVFYFVQYALRSAPVVFLPATWRQPSAPHRCSASRYEK